MSDGIFQDLCNVFEALYKQAKTEDERESIERMWAECRDEQTSSKDICIYTGRTRLDTGRRRKDV